MEAGPERDRQLERERLVSRDRLIEAAARRGIEPAVAEAVWAELAAPPLSASAAQGTGLRRETEPFVRTTRLSRSVKVLLYVGALLVIGSYGWWAGELEFGPGALLALSLVYGAGFLGVALYARKRALDELTGAAAAIVAFYVPVCAYAALRLAGFDFHYTDDGVAAFYLWIDGGWVWMELAAIAAGVALYRVFRAPLLGLPLSLFALFLAMDGTAHVVGLDFDDADAETIGALVLGFGLLASAVGVVLDYRGLRRHALWPHVAAAAGVTCGFEFLLAEHSYELALVLSGAAFLAAGVWLGRDRLPDRRRARALGRGHRARAVANRAHRVGSGPRRDLDLALARAEPAPALARDARARTTGRLTGQLAGRRAGARLRNGQTPARCR